MFERVGLITASLVGLTLFGCSASDAELSGFADRVSTMDREALGAELLHISETVKDPLTDEETRAKLDVIEARVDELDGLIHRQELPDGGTIKFYQRSDGRVDFALFGAASAELPATELSATEAFRALLPSEPVPDALIEAEARAPEMFAAYQASLADPSDGGETNVITQHHDVRNHGSVDFTTWVTQDNPGGYSFVNRPAGDQWYTSQFSSPIYVWRILLNEAPNSGLGSLLISDFQTGPSGDVFFGPHYGPWFSGLGELVLFRTTGTVYEYEVGRWCRILACEVREGIYSASHSVRVRSGGTYHLSGQALEQTTPWAPPAGSLF